MMTMSSGASVGPRTEGLAVHRPSSTIGAVMPESRRPARKVVVFQRPWGIAARRRWPRGARPRSLAIVVLAPVSLMKIRRSGSSSGWLSNHGSRCCAMSGRSCSAACAVWLSPRAYRVAAGRLGGEPAADPLPLQGVGPAIAQQRARAPGQGEAAQGPSAGDAGERSLGDGFCPRPARDGPQDQGPDRGRHLLPVLAAPRSAVQLSRRGPRRDA